MCVSVCTVHPACFCCFANCLCLPNTCMAKLTLQAAAKCGTSRQACTLARGREESKLPTTRAHTRTQTHADACVHFNNAHAHMLCRSIIKRAKQASTHTAPCLSLFLHVAFSSHNHTHTYTHIQSLSRVDKSVLSCSVVWLALFCCVSIIEKEQSLSLTILMVTHTSSSFPLLSLFFKGFLLESIYKYSVD